MMRSIAAASATGCLPMRVLVVISRERTGIMRLQNPKERWLRKAYRPTVEFVSKTRSDAHATCARVTFLAPKSKLLATNPTKARPAGPKKLRPALGGRLTRPLIGPHFSSFRGRFHGFSTIHVGQQVCALPFCARSRVRVARGRARITPAPGGNQPLQIGAAITSHPRRPRMAERVERHPGVEPQEVVLGETESADRRLRFYTTVRPMPFVLVQPDRKFVGATVGCGIGLGVSPFPERGLDEALGLAVGFRRVGLGADVLEAEVAASVAEGEGLIAAAVVGHDADDGDAEAFVISHGRLEEGSGAVDLLVRLDLGEGDAGVIVNADVDELPADAAAVALAGAIAGDAVADPVETTELFDIDVDHLAGRGALIAARRLGRLQVADPV